MTPPAASAPDVNSGKPVTQMSETRRTLAFFTVIIAIVLEVADATIVNTALPAIRDALDATPGQMQWIVAGYMLSLGALLLLGGRLGDALGHSRVFLFGVAAFVVASVLCGLARNPVELVVARLVQGAAGAVMAPQGMAIIQLLFTPLQRVSRMAWFGLVLGLAAILGPILGGLLIELNPYDLGWRVIFLINLPVGILAIGLGLAVLPPAEEKASLRVDPLGAAVFAFGFAGLLYGLIDGPENGWTALPLATLAGGVVLLIFGWHRARGRRCKGLPSVIDPTLFQIATFAWATVAAFCFNAAMVGFLLVFAVSLQQGLGLSPLDTALVHIPFGLGVMAGVGLIAPRLLPRLGKVLPIAGGLVMLVSVVAVLLAIAGGNSGDVLLLGLLVLAGLGMGVISGPLGPIVVAEVDRARAGTASATFRTAQQIGGALGIALVGAAYFAVAGSDAAARLAGLPQAAVVVVLLLAFSCLALSRLPQRIFGTERNA
ncbi:MAG: MFS transporter [Erythrobacter sp.]|nr:MAG: MFS transporter [Erythrobacter sp.]